MVTGYMVSTVFMNCRPLVSLFFVLSAIFMSGSAFAIDCSKARTNDEKIICKSDTLKNYDAAMSQVYSEAWKNTDAKARLQLLASQKQWILDRKKLSDEDQLSDLYIKKIRNQCETFDTVCKSLASNTIDKWQQDKKNPNDVVSIIISSYLKSHLKQYLTDKQELSEVEEDLVGDGHLTALDNVELHKLTDHTTLVTIPLYMGAYQGKSLSFLYNDNYKEFQLVRFPKFEEKLVYPATHSNYADWYKGELMIHNRSQGYLYECGSTQYYTFAGDKFDLVKQEEVNCTPEEMDEIESGTLMPEDLKIKTAYTKK